MMYGVFVVAIFIGGVCMAVEIGELESSLAQAGACDPSQKADTRTVYQAKKQLVEQYMAADPSVAESFAPRLRAALSSPVPAMRIAAAQTLAARPMADDLLPMLVALRAETHPGTQCVLLKCIGNIVSALPDGPAEETISKAIELFETLIHAQGTSPEVRDLLVVSMGSLGPKALPSVRSLAADRRWSSILHSVLPAALGGTGDPAAAADIIAMFESDAADGFRVGCLHALSALLNRTKPMSRAQLAPAVDFLRTTILAYPDRRLSAAACEAYSRWQGAAADQEVVTLLQSRLPQSSGDELRSYLHAAMFLSLSFDEQSRLFLENLSGSDTAPASHRKLAAAILTKLTQDQ
jgi:hypothetical protein